MDVLLYTSWQNRPETAMRREWMSRILPYSTSPMPWLLPMVRASAEPYMARPTVKLRANSAFGYAIFIASLPGSM